jgi:hypothetical protein
VDTSAWITLAGMALGTAVAAGALRAQTKDARRSLEKQGERIGELEDRLARVETAIEFRPTAAAARARRKTKPAGEG